MTDTRYFPLSKEELEKVSNTWHTPFYVYDERAIRENARKLKKAFSIMPDFREYFAVKALPNPHILRILHEEGFGTDCSSLPELILSEKSGVTGEMIMFTSNETPAEEFVYAYALGAIINLDDITHIDFLEKALKGEIPANIKTAQEESATLPELLCFRYNPGALKEGNAIIGKPEEAKYGLTRDQIFEAYVIAQKKGVKRFGLHTMVASNELSNDYFVETARLLYELALELYRKLGIVLDFINIGGGIGIPYKPEQKAVDYEYIASGIKKAYTELIEPVWQKNGFSPMRLYMECARVITGPYGYLVTKAIHEKHIYREYIGVDASMADLMRPGMYGFYHHVSIAGKETAEQTQTYDIVGSLCENCDKFAVQRSLPKIDIGDFIIIHDAGAHGRAMGFNYNAKLRCGELLLKENGEIIQIRRPESIEDYFATLIWE